VPSSVLVQAFDSDLTGAEYLSFLEMMLSSHARFSLVWRDQLTFNEKASAVRSDLKRFEVDHRRKDRWPGTRLLGKAGKALIVNYSARLEAIPQLAVPGSLFSWLSPNFPEDLAFYDENGVCTFTSVSHEKEAYILEESTGSMLATLTKLFLLEVGEDTGAVLTGT
jgi:hypothetical protein